MNESEKLRLTVTQLLEEKRIVDQLEKDAARRKADLMSICHHPEELRYPLAPTFHSPRSRPTDVCTICGARLEKKR